MTTCTVLTAASALHDAAAVDAVVGAFRPQLAAAGVQLADTVEAADPTLPLAVFVLTGGSERQVLQAWQARQQLVPGEPLLLLTHPGQNSLPAALEVLARLQMDGARGRIVMLHVPLPTDPPNGLALRAAIHDMAVWHRLHRARLGVIGTPSEWLVASVPDATAVQARWGISLVHHELAAVMDRFVDNIEAPIAEPVRLRARRHEGEPHPADVETAGRFEPVLREVVAGSGYDAVTVRCFDLVTDAHTSGCLALSSLNDHGIVAGCEGDVAATVALLWLRHLIGRIGWMANPAAIDEDTGTIELAHCTVPLSLVESFELDTHFESGIGVGINGHFAAGPVTVVRLGGRGLEHLWVADGQALMTDPRHGRCRTQLDVVVPPERAGELLRRPLGNHLVVLPGHHAHDIRQWWSMMVADAT
ncbi:MAG: hypothetical protein KDB06_13385 [Ilumatobacter sp.]|nr:hypothetical protein [Ilumatobacter sp.]MCB0985636.1 hypothetical protein [Ilumatobacter sp.]